MTLTIGELRREMGVESQGKLGEILDQNQHKKAPYYIIKRSYQDPMKPNVFHTRFILRSDIPVDVKFLGTECYYVDNQKGQLKRLWSLPADVPRIAGTEGREVQKVLRSAQGQIIIY